MRLAISSGILVDIQEALRPMLLRRMKEDVEDLPEKEEVIVWVRLTQQQHAYYKAIYQNQVSQKQIPVPGHAHLPLWQLL